jgi:hypothetical protein
MGTRAYVGRPDPTDPTIVHLRYVHSDATPEYMVPTIAAIVQHTFAGDTTATVTALLEHTWTYLGVDVTDAHTSLHGDTPVAGVGMSIGTAEAEPPTTMPAATLDRLWVRWIYLIDPHASTLTVLSTDDPANPTATYTFTHTAIAEDQR